MFNQRNFLTGTIAALLFAVAVTIAAVTASAKADDVRIERERTAQVKVEECGTIEDPEVKALCIASIGQPRGGG